MNDLTNCVSLDDVKNWLAKQTDNGASLLAEFERLKSYQNAVEWNQLVLACEAITMRGWDLPPFNTHEPVQAFCGKGVSGSWETALFNSQWQVSYSSRFDWSKNGDSFKIYLGADTQHYGVTKLNSQRNLLPTNPFRIGRFIANCQQSVKAFVAEVASLHDSFETQMQPKHYGEGFYYVNINTNFSAHDWPGHYSVQSQYFHAQSDVPNDSENAYVVPHMEFGKLSTKRDCLCWRAELHYTKAWGELPLGQQKQSLADDLSLIFAELETRLTKKKVDYQIKLAIEHANSIIKQWLSSTAEQKYYQKIENEFVQAKADHEKLWI